MRLRCLLVLFACFSFLGPIKTASAQSDAEMAALQRDVAAYNARCANVSPQDTARLQACASEKASLEARKQQIQSHQGKK